MKKQRLVKFLTATCVFVLTALLAGCATTYKVEGVFTHPSLLTYNRLAMTGLTPEREQLLMSSYIHAFDDSAAVFVERARLQELLQEQDLHPDRLDEGTRAQLAKVLGVQGIVFGTYTLQATDLKKIEKLLVRVVGTETGEITGSVLVEAESRSGVRMSQLADRAAQALHASASGSAVKEEPEYKPHPSSLQQGFLDRRSRASHPGK